MYRVRLTKRAKVDLCLDSGAHSLFMSNVGEKFKIHTPGTSVVGNRMLAIKRQTRTAEQFVKTKEFKKYVEGYIDYVYKVRHQLAFYVNVDLIGQPRLSWEMQRYLEDCGLNPLPVYHNFEDRKWFKKYLDRYDYIGVGGIGKTVMVPTWIRNNRFVFDWTVGKNGERKARLHGFAMGSPVLLEKFPWYSVDASSANIASRYGMVFFPYPILKGKEVQGWDFLRKVAVRFSDKAKKDWRHFKNQPDTLKGVFEEYLGRYGYTSEFLIGSYDDYLTRDELNLIYFRGKEDQLREVYKEKFSGIPGPRFYVSGNPVTGTVTDKSMKGIISSIRGKEDFNLPFRFMGTYYYPHVFEVIRRL